MPAPATEFLAGWSSLLRTDKDASFPHASDIILCRHLHTLVLLTWCDDVESLYFGQAGADRLSLWGKPEEMLKGVVLCRR